MSGRVSWPYWPYTIQIETTQGCNRRCIFCGSMGVEKKVHYADIDTIRHTCDLIRESGLTSRILLAGHGEPTLHPDIVKIVKEIRYRLPENTIHMFTNGTVLLQHPERIRNLFNAGLNDLVFDEYSDHRMDREIKSNPVCRHYEIVNQGKGVPMMAPKGTRQRICITPPIDEGGNTSNRNLINHCGAGAPPLKKPMQARCSVIFRDIFIRYDGNITICCNDFRGEYFVTNINECGTLQEAYFNPRLEAARRILMTGQRGSIYPCSVCNERPIRPGLLPSAKGGKMPHPTDNDYETVAKNREPLAVIEKRPWEI